MRYARSQPAKVASLVIEGCPAFIEGFKIPPFMKVMTMPLMKWLIPKIPTTQSFARKLLMDMGHTAEVVNSRIPSSYFNWYVSMCNDTITLKNDLQIINKAMHGGKVDSQYIIEDKEFSRMKMPTQWLWGNRDPFASPETGKRLSSLMNNSSIVFFSQGGHLPWLDEPDVHAQLLDKFFLRVHTSNGNGAARIQVFESGASDRPLN